MHDSRSIPDAARYYSWARFLVASDSITARPAIVTPSTGCYDTVVNNCSLAHVWTPAIEQNRKFVLLQFYCSCVDAYNKRAYNKTQVCFIAVLFYFYCSCAGRLRFDLCQLEPYLLGQCCTIKTVFCAGCVGWHDSEDRLCIITADCEDGPLCHVNEHCRCHWDTVIIPACVAAAGTAEELPRWCHSTALCRSFRCQLGNVM